MRNSLRCPFTLLSVLGIFLVMSCAGSFSVIGYQPHWKNASPRSAQEINLLKEEQAKLKEKLRKKLISSGFSKRFADRVTNAMAQWSYDYFAENLKPGLERHGIKGQALSDFSLVAEKYIDLSSEVLAAEPIKQGANSAEEKRVEIRNGTAVGSNIQVNATTQQILDALISDPVCKSFVTGITMSASNPNVQIQVAQTYGLTPTDGNLLIMSSADPFAPSQGGDLDFPPNGCGGDTARIDITFNITDPSVRSMSLKFDFYSYEFPEFVGFGFNDFVFAYWDQAISANASCVPGPLTQFCPSGEGCAASTSQSGGLLTFDQQSPCNPTNVDNAFFQLCKDIGCDSAPDVPGWNTEFNSTPGDDAGRTGDLTTSWPVTQGTHTLTLLVGDAGDGIYTTTGVFDQLSCGTNNIGCSVTTAPCILDTEPPQIVSCPRDIVQPADANQCSAVVNYPVPGVIDNCTGATIICVPPSGQRLDAGTSQSVTCTATDAKGNTSSCSFRISVQDAQPPTINCPTTPVQIDAGGACTITVPDITATFRNSISDACTPATSLTVTQSPAPNTSVASDLRAINITVTDGAGVSTTCRVPVTVINSGGQAAQVTIGSGNELDLSVKLLSKKKSKKKVKPVVDTGTFTVKNVKCDGTSLTLPFGGVRRLTDAGAGKPINDPDDNDFFSVFIGCGASRTRLNVGQNISIGFGEEVCFTVEFDPTIPPVASATTNLSASEVLPADFRSEVVLDGINPVVIRARVDGGVRLIDPATGSSNNPVVTICQSGNNEFTVRYHAWSPSKSDVRSVKYEFLDSSGSVIKTLDVDLAGPISGTSLVNGQSFNIEQSFSGTGVSSVRVTLNGANSSSTATSGSISSNCPSAIRSPSQQRATLFLPGLTVDAVKP